MTSCSADAHLSGRNADLPERRPAPDREAARPHLRSESLQAGALINEIAIMILSAPADEPYTHIHTHTYALEHGSGRIFLSEPRPVSDRVVTEPESDSHSNIFFRTRTELDGINFSTVHTNATFTYVFYE